MSEPLQLVYGQVVRLKKPHPCGSFDWQVLRIGMDIGLRCEGCNHYVLLGRRAFERSIHPGEQPPAVAPQQPASGRDRVPP